MSAQSPKSVVRSIRITKELDDLIRRDASEKGVTLNAMISSILHKYADWDRHAERFRFVSLPRDAFRILIEAIDDRKLIEIAENFGPTKSREMALAWFKRVNLETYLQYMAIQSRYGGLPTFEIEAGAAEDTITFAHDLGPKYSLLLSRYVEQTLESIADVSSESSIEENALAIHLPPGTLANGPRP